MGSSGEDASDGRLTRESIGDEGSGPSAGDANNVSFELIFRGRWEPSKY